MNRDALTVAAVLVVMTACAAVGAWCIRTGQEDFERFHAACQDFAVAVGAPFVPLACWLDRQLQRWPRLYAWLGR